MQVEGHGRCNKWLMLLSAEASPRLKSAKCLKEQQISNLPKAANPKQPGEKILIKCCRQQTLSGQRGAKNMGKEVASSSSLERVIATSVSTFPKGKSNTCPAFLSKRFFDKHYFAFSSSSSLTFSSLKNAAIDFFVTQILSHKKFFWVLYPLSYLKNSDNKSPQQSFFNCKKVPLPSSAVFERKVGDSTVVRLRGL